jgi:hypothetical protein
MSKENVEIVRRAYDAFNARDRAAFLRMCDPEVEFRSALEQKTYRGFDEMVRWREDVVASWRPALRRAGVREARVHDLRHTYGARLAARHPAADDPGVDGSLGLADHSAVCRLQPGSERRCGVAARAFAQPEPAAGTASRAIA